jgi:hypothetical protein
VLSILFPAVAYGLDDAASRTVILHLLGVRAAIPAAYRRAYLALWARHGDLNFARAAREFGLRLDRPSAAAA